jgi:hypothetical protein
MRGSPSQYGGIAAVLVLGVGLLIVGFNMPPEQHERAIELRWTGAFISVFGLLVMGISLSQTLALKALFVAIGATIGCGTFIYLAASNEISGTATYHSSFLAKDDKGEVVTRVSAPEKFRAATNVWWGGGALCFGVSVIGFTIYRKIGE